MQVSTVDQMGLKVEAPSSPKSIISLVPSQTELLFDLGLTKEVKGITKFCIHPAELVRDVAKVGGTKNFRFKAFEEIQPDLIIGNKEENYKEGIDKLKRDYPVWMSDVFNLKDALDMILKVSKLVGKQSVGQRISEEIRQKFSQLKKAQSRRVLYFIWQKPFMVAGSNTFIDDMLNTIGLTNAIQVDRYPELTPEDIKEINPDLILLSSEPYPFKAKHFSEFKDLCPTADIRVVDGEMFSWYGSRILKAPGYFNSLNL